MTLDELDANYKAASWLIAKRSAAAAGKALMFSADSLDAASKEIAAIYGLNDEEWASVLPTNAESTLATVQTAANGLFGDTMGLSTSQAMSVAKKAVASGQKIKVLQTLMRAGPNAAKAVAAGGKAAGRTAGGGTPWGWIATAAYAAGTGSWFAFNLRAFNLAAYEMVRSREGIETPPERLNEKGLLSARTFAPVLSTISAGADAVGTQAGAVWDGAVERGGRLADATGGLVGLIGATFRKKPRSPDT
jgi:hypothetical protein